MTHLYNDYCPDCGDQRIHLSADKNTSFKHLLNTAKNTYKQLHEKGKYSADDISQYNELIDATHGILKEALNKGIADNVIPEAMRQGLENDIFIFSGLKTHAQLLEASRMLLTDDGKIKPFYQFSKDVANISSNYNQLYLEAEYQFAVSSSQQAANWAKIEEGGTRYNIQYRTAGDDKVRDNHAVLNGITLAFEDEFWNEYYPPNGWRCRCKALQVLKSKYPVSDSIDAISKGQKATTLIGKDGKNRLEIFRFNPGKQKVVFTPDHPYTKVQDAAIVKNLIQESKLTDDYLESLKQRGFEYKEYDAAGKELWNENFSKFDLKQLDSNMDELAKSYGVNWKNKIISVEENVISIQYNSFDNKVKIERSFSLENSLKVVKHSYFELSYDLQGKGFSKDMFKIFHNQYNNSDLDIIKLHANLEVGGYAWAKYGFQPSRPNDMIDIVRKAESLYKNGELTDKEYAHFTNIKDNAKNNLLNLNQIANSSYGKKVLLRSDWRGELDLKNPLQKKIYEDYLFGRK